MKAVFLLPLLVLTAACAGSGADYVPVLDGAPSAGFNADLAACQALARDQHQFDRETAGSAAIGAGIGALAGVADDEVSDAEGIAGGLIVGALAGAAAGAGNAAERREAIVVECLRGRGHAVVG